MSRRHRAEKREINPDPKFGDLTVTKFMNYVMYEGKKAVAENILYGAFDILEAKRKDQSPLETFHAALENVAAELLDLLRGHLTEVVVERIARLKLLAVDQQRAGLG